MERRQNSAALIRSWLREDGVTGDARIFAVADELEALASELDDGSLALDPAAAVDCKRMLSDFVESPLLEPASPLEERWSRISIYAQAPADRHPGPRIALCLGSGSGSGQRSPSLR